jgi:diadenylate cyclase
LHSVRWQSIVDFVVLGFALYALLRWSKQARAIRIALGIVGVFTGSLIARHLDLIITSWVLQAAGLVTVLLLLMVFQAELRRDVMRLDRLLRFGLRRSSVVASDSHMIGEAAFLLAKARLGALIVVVRHDPVSELVDAGITFGAEISVETLEAIFQKESPLHDGAAIIEDDRISKVNTVLPLTQRGDVPNSYGTRHRAAMGLAERCDALVITVSEERGEVTVMQGRDRKLIPDQGELVRVLDALQRPATISLSARVRGALLSNLRLKLVAAGLAAIIWGVSFLATSTTVRIVSVPVQFSNVPPGMDISEQSATRLEVQLRGSPWPMESSNITNLVASFDLKGIRQGWLTLRVSPDDLNLPPGVLMERAFPRTLSVHLAAQASSGSP